MFAAAVERFSAFFDYEDDRLDPCIQSFVGAVTERLRRRISAGTPFPFSAGHLFNDVRFSLRDPGFTHTDKDITALWESELNRQFR